MLLSRSLRLSRMTYITVMLNDSLSYFIKGNTNYTAVLTWGYRASAIRAEKLAIKKQLPLVRLEDGFIRSMGLGCTGHPFFSLVIDDLSIYYYASTPSRLEKLIIEQTADLSFHITAQKGLQLLYRWNLSKYNHAPAITLPEKTTLLRVLIIDQTVGDMSVTLGGANQAVFAQMLNSAILEYPDAEIWVKTHPDVLAGKKQGYLPKVYEPVQMLAQDICPYSLLSQVDIVYTATSHMGFEALVTGCKVVCFGMPWYCGWGLTDDRHPDMPVLKQRRNVTRSLEQLFYAAYLQYALYIQPDRGICGTFFDLAEWIALNKWHHKATTGTLWCIGMSLWKRKVVKPFLSSPNTKLRFIRSLSALPANLPENSKLVCWGIQPEVEHYAHQHNLPLLRMEDGFLRSVGLGSHLQPPLSLVADSQGIYYDAARPSSLELLIKQQVLSAEQLQLAAELRQKLVTHKISKYNVGSAITLPAEAKGKKIVLVAGQVESDASLHYGARDIHTNLQLLQAARQAAPQSWIIYKPHPDVVSGTRKGEVNHSGISSLADQIITTGNIADCLQLADEVHVITSLAGFEALLHGKVVHCHGSPFYAGWGLTHDRYPLPNRLKKVSINELAYAALITYPRYVIPGRPGFARPEAVADYLVQHQRQSTVDNRWLARQGRKIYGLWRTLRQ